MLQYIQYQLPQNFYSSISVLSCFLTRVARPLPGHPAGVVPCGSGTAWWRLDLLSRLPGSTVFTYIATSIACLSVLGERSLLCGSSWGFFHPFFFLYAKSLFFNMGCFSSLGSKGLKDRGCCSLYRSQSPLRQCDCDFQAILVKLICFPPSLCLPQQVQHEENRTLLSHFLQKFPWLNHSQICSKWFFFFKENNYVLILVVSADQTQINDSMKPANDVFYKEAKKNPCLQRRWLVVYF